MRSKITQDAFIVERGRSKKCPVHARPTLRVRLSSGEVKSYENCVEVAEGNTVHAFLPPRQGGFVLSLITSTGPSAVYEVVDPLRRWYCAEVRDRE